MYHFVQPCPFTIVNLSGPRFALESKQREKDLSFAGGEGRERIQEH